jgi:hypothetical protein
MLEQRGGDLLRLAVSDRSTARNGPAHAILPAVPGRVLRAVTSRCLTTAVFEFDVVLT